MFTKIFKAVIFFEKCLALALSVTPIYPVFDKGVKTQELKIKVMIVQGEFNGKQIIVFTPNKTKNKIDSIKLSCEIVFVHVYLRSRTKSIHQLYNK
jgi:hypothetical protein